MKLKYGGKECMSCCLRIMTQLKVIEMYCSMVNVVNTNPLMSFDIENGILKR